MDLFAASLQIVYIEPQQLERGKTVIQVKKVKKPIIIIYILRRGFLWGKFLQSQDSEEKLSW